MATKKNTNERREKGTGTIYQRGDSWVGKIDIGVVDGKRKFKYLSGKTEAEVKRKIREFNKSNDPAEVKKVSVETYLMNWLRVYKKSSMKASSYDTLEGTALRYVIPSLGSIQLAQLGSDDIQSMITSLKEGGKSHSIVKKAHDCIGAMLKHATIKGDISSNPMLLVNMPPKDIFEKKEIRIFTPNEVRLITEEATRCYTTGAPVYVYGDAYILMLNTGLRMGEVIGLRKSDWNQEEKTLHVQRNIQRVKRRDSDGNATQGFELAENTTKTYSGDRVIPLNIKATEALQRLTERHPESDIIVCSTKGAMVPPERFERTLYFMLDNLGIERAGTHSLRHTFASLLFANGTDVKTVSKILGHASIQITLNTYIHLIEKADHKAVAVLDSII